MRRLLIVLLLLASPAIAQDDGDRGYIAGLLEDALGGEGRTVRIIGFDGALSSTATVERITITDPDGIWLTVENAELQWDRSALLGRRIMIQTLRAESITLARLPQAVPSDAPSPEATPFRLPELPVSILIEDLRVDRFVLGAPVLGEEVVFAVTGRADLAEGAGSAALTATRLGDWGGEFALAARFDNATEALDFDLSLTEPAGGLVAGLLKVPDAPALSLAVEAEGTLDDLSGDLVLRTGGVPRLTGTLEVQTDAGIRDFALRMGGDVTALFAPQYRPFFGDDVAVTAQGQQAADGALSLDVFRLTAAALNLDGTLAIGADGQPEKIDLTGALTPPQGQRVLLPVPGADTSVTSAGLMLRFDADTGDVWTGELRVDGLQMGGTSLASARLRGTGQLSEDGFDADINFDTADLALADPGLMRALGATPQGALRLIVSDGDPIVIEDLRLSAAAGALTGELAFDALEQTLGQTFDLKLKSDDLSPLSGLVGLDLGGAAALSLTGAADPGGAFDITLSGDTTDLTLGQDMLDGLLGGAADVRLSARRDGSGITLRNFEIAARAISAQAAGTIGSDQGSLDYSFRLSDAALVGSPVAGPVTASGIARNEGDGWIVDADLDAPADVTAQLTADLGEARRVTYTARVPDVAAYGAPLTGAALLDGTISDPGTGWRIDTDLQGPDGIVAQVAGPLSPLDLQYSAEVPSLSSLGVPVPGGASLNGDIRQGDDGLIVTANGTGPYASRISVNVDLSAPLTASFDVTLPDARPLGVPYAGALRLNGVATRQGDSFVIDTDLTGPLGSSGDVIAQISETISAEFNIALPDARPLGVPFAGALRASGTATRSAEGRLSVQADLAGPLGATGTVDAQFSDGLSGDFTLQIPDVASLGVPANGPLRVTGNAAQTAQGLRLTANATGPAGARAQLNADLNGGLSANYTVDLPNAAAFGSPIAGRVTLDGTARQSGDNVSLAAQIGGLAGTRLQLNGTVGGTTDLNLQGSLPLTLVNPFIDPASVAGVAQVDLRVTALSLSGLSGTLNATDARLVFPAARLVLDPTRLALRFDQGRMVVDANGQLVDGGEVQVTGPITLGNGFPANLAIGLRRARLVDPQLYDTRLGGTITITGPLSGGAQIAGQITLDETQLRVPETGMSGPSSIPYIRHVGLPRPVARTFERAGLSTRPTARPEIVRTQRPYGLNLQISAPNRIFLRGRGLDAELGGAVRISGTTQEPVTAGEFTLVRGRLDILGQRFALNQGRILLEGDFDPRIRFVATTQTDIGTASIIVAGRVSSPEVSFVSDPVVPEDEVLALILFGRGTSDISPLQALQLANAVATLAGRGAGSGIFESLRNGLDLDDLDLTSGDNGDVAVRAGKYISENVYTDVTVGSGTSELSINIDVTPDITARGTTDSAGETSLGIFFERDY